MLNFNSRHLVVVLLGITFFSSPLNAQLLPTDVGTTVSGFQDDFEGASLNPNWVVRGQPVYSVSGGMLHVASSTGDPNHLLYEIAGYNNSVQEVLARIRITNFGTGDAPRGGISTCIDPGTSQGINWFFRDEPSPGQRHFEFLDDARAWGTELPFAWQNNVWYWLRLRHEPNAASQGGVNDAFGKIWLADGSQAEPAAWQATFDYIPGRTARVGFAGIGACSLGGPAEFDVDYVLIKASGLPSINVTPNAFISTSVTITNQPQNLTAIEGNPATFTVGATGNPQPTYQWHRDNVPIPNATNSSYTIPFVQIADHGAVFKVVAQNVVSNTTHTVTSSNAVLTVIGDDGPPSITSVQAIGLTQVQIGFSERVQPNGATNPASYLVTNLTSTLTVSGAFLDGSQSNVTLNVSAMTDGATYTLVVNNVMDLAGNVIAANTTTNFTAISYTSAAIGSPQPPGSAVPAPGGLNVLAGGRDIGGTSDQLQFNHQMRTGDFDVKVRLDSLSLADAWSEAGLLAREDLSAGARFAGALATPNISGAYFQSRVTAGGVSTISGSFPVNYPNTWLRLQRAGNIFIAYAGFDGQNWTALGSTTIAMPASIFLGFAAASHNTNQTTTAAFRDFSNVTSAGVNGPLPVEALGQSSRRTSLVISEIMYNPLDRPDERNVEFVELFNSLGTPEDISGWRLDGDADFTFPPNTVIPGGGFLVIAQSPADVEAVYGITGVLGPFSNTNNLPNDNGTVQLRNRIGAVFLEANYDTVAPWPIAADGAGHSIVLARPSYGERNVEAWAASDSIGGSPGRLDPVTLNPLRNVVINEFLAHTDEPQLDFIELYNHGNQPVDISGCFLSDDREVNKFVIPPGTILPPRGFVSYNQTQLAFALGSDGERIYFRNGARVIDAIQFEAQANGVSTGRSPDGAPVFSELTSNTPGTNNSAILIRNVVINEIMYNPISRNSDDEFVELFNRSSNAVNLTGWRLRDGITFTFPANTTIPAGGYLVVARNATRLISRYANLNSLNTLGNFDGSLANSGERIALTMPDPSFTTNGSVIITNFNHIVVDEVAWRDGGRWGQWSDGGGSSLELIDARGDNRLAANWADSDESAKAPWTLVNVPGVLDNGSTANTDQLQVLLQGPGECLIDNVEVVNTGNTNFVANSTFETDASGWTAEGTQSQSGHETAEGFNSARSYRVRAVDRGDNQVNRIRTPLTAVQSPGATMTIRARVRWLRGHPEILFRLRGNFLDAGIAMDLPTNLGTPGARNSRAVNNAPPAISDVTHYPPVPSANEAVVVTARVHDPDGVPSLELRYRIDPNAALTNLVMLDNGTGGDAVAGDGLYSGTIPSQPANTLIAFHVRATDGFAPAAISTFPNNVPTRECLVRFGESVPTGNFPSYRFWMTQASFNAWDTRHNLNNTLNDVTFVLGNHRVIYNVGAVYAGSPYIGPSFDTPTGRRCGYSIEMPADDRFLGDSALVLDWPGGHGNENTALQEQMAYWMAEKMDIAYSHRYYIRLTINGVTDMQRLGVFEAVMQPNSDFLEQWSPADSEGDFFKIDRAFEFNDGGGLIADPEPQLRLYTTPDLVNGGTKKKIEKYRWYWLKRAYDSANDFTNIFIIADALNATSPEPYTSQTEALADVEQWMGIFCAEHIINNFDSWGHDIGKNMYMFKPSNGRWQLYMFDLDWLMLVSPGGPGNYTASTGPLFSSDDPTVTRMYNHPPFRRAYFRAVENAVNRAFVASKYEAAMDARYNSLVANGITLCDGQALAPPTLVKTWFSQRRDFLVTQLAGVNANFAITSHGGNDFTTNLTTVTISGTAPVTVKTIRVNGMEYPIVWTSVTGWSLRIPLANGQNALSLVGYDVNGNALTNFTDTITITSSAVPESPAGRVVINEIMYNPRGADAEFVEIYNAATNTAFDLSGWRLNGADFTFAGGTLLDPNGYLVVAKDRDTFAATYSSSIVPAGEFAGALDGGGETLSLVKPGATPDLDTLIDIVTYDDDPPWPASADGTGSSLQLIDPTRDNSRVANWADGAGWKFYSFTGTPGLNATSLLLFLAAAGNVYVDNVSLVAGSQAGVGSNILVNGDFETGTLAPWQTLGGHSNSTVSANVAYAGNYSLFIVASGPGSLGSTVIQTIPALNSTGTYTFSMWYLTSTNGTGVNFRSTTTFRSVAPINYRPVLATAGTTNSVAARLPAFPELWLNELQPNNITGIMDNVGDREPWVELYNSGSSTINLDGWYLADNYTNLTRWAFPVGTSIGPGQFRLVWLDGESFEATPSALHSSFRISPAVGSLALVFPLDGKPSVLDYINYNLTGERSIGYYPDGEFGPRDTFFITTPGGTNNSTPAPLPVFINEWMAANTTALPDPADGDFDDWFELYNPNDVEVDLTGYSLSDTLAVGGARWGVPLGSRIPPFGYLLVWADSETGQNATNRTDLHANFRLSQDGEAIGLFAPNGSVVDSVVFGPQTNNISEGRWPDGNVARFFMPTYTPRAANVIPNPPAQIEITEAYINLDGALVISWTSQAGRTYRVQFKDDLNDEWENLINVNATGTSASAIISVTQPHRYFRIQYLAP